MGRDVGKANSHIASLVDSADGHVRAGHLMSKYFAIVLGIPGGQRDERQADDLAPRNRVRLVPGERKRLDVTEMPLEAHAGVVFEQR